MTNDSKRNRPARSSPLRLLMMACAVLMIGALLGCDDEQVRSYQAPKAAPYEPPGPMSQAGGERTAGPGITWELPEDWQPVPDKSGMAMVLFDVPGESEGSRAARVSVTPLTSKAGGILPNINRWRNQVGLELVKTIEEQPMTGIQVDQSPAGLIDLASPQDASAKFDRILVVLVPRVKEDRTWFFKMTGPDDIVTRHKQSFVAFVESVSFGDPTGE